MVYTFSQNDQMASDDEFRFNINLTEDFVDVVADIDHNPISHVQNLPCTTGNKYNTGTDYVFKAKGESTLCGVCTLGQFGWQLWDAEDTTMLKEAYKTVANLPAWAEPTYNINLPAFNFDQEGRFLLKYGLFSSTGNPYADLNPSNNLASFEIVLNDSIDLKVVDVYPSHSAQSSLFYYGTDRSSRPTPTLATCRWRHLGLYQVYNSQYDLEVDGTCLIPVMHPGRRYCNFNMTTTGNNRLIRVQMPTIYQNGEDAAWATTCTSDRRRAGGPHQPLRADQL